MNEINNKALAIMDMAMKISQNSEMNICAYYTGSANTLDVFGYKDRGEDSEADLLPEKYCSHHRTICLDEERKVLDNVTPDEVLSELESIWEGICNGQAESKG